MAIVLHGSLRASEDKRKYFLSGHQEIVFKELTPELKIATDGTDEVELMEVILFRVGISGLPAIVAKAAENLGAGPLPAFTMPQVDPPSNSTTVETDGSEAAEPDEKSEPGYGIETVDDKNAPW